AHLCFEFPVTTGPKAPGWLAILTDKNSQYSSYVAGVLKAKLKSVSQIRGYMTYTGLDEGDMVYDKLDMAAVISWLLEQGSVNHICPAIILYHSLLQETDADVHIALAAVGVSYLHAGVLETMDQFNI
ncbi:MAG: hypothetical protein ACMV0F_07890, partial [Trichlorobacter sp.]